ncbi:MAG: hypothetical protein GY722_22890 [bacterium]|nr:hypothetical protein [bacterium]
MIITNEAACALAEEAAEIDFDRKRYNAAYKSFRDYIEMLVGKGGSRTVAIGNVLVVVEKGRIQKIEKMG